MGIDAMSLDLGFVVATYPQGPSIDVLMPNGDQLSNVQVMVPTGSDCTGHVDLPDIGGPVDSSRWQLSMQPEHYVRAVVSYLHGIPVCLGFLLPPATQVTFAQKNRRIMRHASDVYTSVDDQGNTEIYHPSGTYFRIGASPAHEDLTGKDYDGLWAIKRNTGSAPHVHLTVANAGSPVASVDIDPSGNITLQNNGNLTATVGGNAEADISGTTTVDSGGAATVKAPSVTVNSPQTTFTGAVLVEGPLVFQSGLSGQAGAGGGAAVQIQGGINSTGDQVAGGISQMYHHHNDPQGGEVGTPF